MRKSYGFCTLHVTEIALYHALSKLPEPEVAHDSSDEAEMKEIVMTSSMNCTETLTEDIRFGLGNSRAAPYW